MLQTHAYVSLHCDQCGNILSDPDVETQYATEDAALEAAAKQGWRWCPEGRRLCCPACAPMLDCDTQGHQFTPWRQILLGGEDFPLDVTLTPVLAANGASDGALRRTYRYCRRCCLVESDPTAGLVGSRPGQGTTSMGRLIELTLAATSGRGVA